MTLIFNPNQSPFGVVALQGITKSITLELVADTKVSSLVFEPLSVPALLNETLLLRYFARSSSSDLYASEKQLAIDTVLDRVDACTSIPQLIKELFPKPRSFMVGDALTIADLSVWSQLKQAEGQNLKAAELFLTNMAKYPELEDAVKVVSHLVPQSLEQVPKSSDKKSAPKPKIGLSNQSQSYKRDDAMAKIRLAIGQELEKLTGLDALTCGDCLEITRGPSMETADLSVPLPKLRVKGQSAADYAEKIQCNEFLASVTAYGSHLNFKISKRTVLGLVVADIYAKKDAYGTNDSLKGQNYIVEFSSPNIAKPFHAGHLRSTIIGNFVRNIAKANGANTTAINYLGDWGKQYGLLAVGYEQFGSEVELTKDPIKHLFDVYVKINKAADENPAIQDQARAYFKRMEERDEAALGIWKRFRDLSIVKYEQIYERLNVKFDVYSGESQYSDGMIKAMEHMKSKNLLSNSEGAIVVDLKQFKLSAAVVQKADGATLYITRDIAAASERHDQYKFDKMFYIVGSQQDFHFQQLFKILELSGYKWSKQCEHINFGMIRGMSSRKGTVVFLEDILDEAASVMLEKMKSNEEKAKHIVNLEQTADIIGLSAVIVQDLNSKRGKDYEFSWNKMTSFEGDTGPYLQYSHSRLCSIERQFTQQMGKEVSQLPFSLDIVLKNDHPKMLDLAFFLAQYPELVARIPKTGYEPCNIVTYLMQICHRISSCLDEVYVMDSKNVVADKEVLLARFWVYWSARITLGNGMKLLGLKPLERM